MSKCFREKKLNRATYLREVAKSCGRENRGEGSACWKKEEAGRAVAGGVLDGVGAGRVRSMAPGRGL